MLWLKFSILVLLSDNVFSKNLFSKQLWNEKHYGTLDKRTPSLTPMLAPTTSEIQATLIEESTTTEEPVTTEGSITTTTEGSITTTTEETTTTTNETTSTEETTTEIPTTTESPAMCNSSLHSKNDLLMIFNYIEKEYEIEDNIIDSFDFEAELIVGNHLKNISAFRRWFQDRPHHLEHVLEDIRDTRQQLLPVVEDIANTLNTFPKLYEEFQNQLEIVDKLLDYFKKQKKICELSCDQEHFVERVIILKENIPYDKNKFYCGSIAEVHQEIKDKLSLFSEHVQEAMKQRLSHDNIKYSREIEQLKINIKDLALKEFGHTMYDILDLQDAYYHFSDFIKNNDFKHIVKEVRKSIVMIKPYTMLLESGLQNLTKYCKTCNRNIISRRSDAMQDETPEEPTEKVGTNILEDLMQVELQRLEDNIDVHYTSIFNDLEDRIKEATSTNSFIDNIKPMQAEIMKATVQELSELIKLQELISKDYITGLNDLHQATQDLFDEFDESFAFIAKYSGYRP